MGREQGIIGLHLFYRRFSGCFALTLLVGNVSSQNVMKGGAGS
jgi:hypothetical protein